MQTSTPSDGKRHSSRDIRVLNISPVYKKENEAEGKAYSRRERKPRRWDGFETDPPSKHQRNETEASGMAKETSSGWSSEMSKRCDTEIDSVEILIEEQDTRVSATKISPAKKEPENADRKSKSKAKKQNSRNDNSEESSIKVKPCRITRRVVKSKKSASQDSVNKASLSDEKQLLSHRIQSRAQCSSRDFEIDDTDNMDDRLTPNRCEMMKLRDAVESKRITKYIDKSDRVMESKNDLSFGVQSKNPKRKERVHVVRKLTCDILAKTECNVENFEKGTELSQDVCISNKSKDAAFKKTSRRNQGRQRKSVIEDSSLVENSSLEFDKSVDNLEVDIDESINTASSYKTPIRKRGRHKVNEEGSHQKSGTEESSGYKSVTRRRVTAKSVPGVETDSTDETVKVFQGSRRQGRKRKELNYSDLDSGDLDTEEEDARKRPKKELVRDQEDESSINNDSSYIEKSSQSKEAAKMGQCYKCHHCDHTGKGVPDIRRHYAVKHQLWWSENCPEGNADRASLTKIFKIKKFLNCTKCDKQINFVTYYPNHLEWCGRESLTYTCDYCNKENLVLRWQNLHLKTCPGLIAQTVAEKKKKQEEELGENDEEDLGRGKKRKAAKKAMSMVHDISKELDPTAQSDHSDNDPDAVIPEDDENDDEDEIDDDEINEDESVSSFGEEDDEDIVDFDADDGDQSFGGSFMRFSSYFNPFPIMEDFVQENWSQELFIDWLPLKEDWQQLSQQESEPYLPTQNTSVRFSFGNEECSATLEVLESKHIDGSPLFCTGLNVWQVAWCPMPLQCTDVQYLAVTGKLQYSELFLTDERFAGNSLIQIWNTGISSNKNNPTASPQLSYNIVQDYGLVTHMVWCPSGCYKTNQNQANIDAHTRLGLLAVSYTDGACRLFSIPLLPSGGVGPTPTYRAKPIISLIPYNNYEQHDVTCSCVDWTKSSGHSKVLTGYSNGAVKLFNLMCKSPLQYLKTSEGLKLLPYINLQPHGNLVRAVSFCSTLETVIITSSEDFETYFWDLNNLGAPLQDEGGFYMTVSMCTSVLQHGVYLGCDDNYAFLTNKGRYVESGHLLYYGKPEHRKEERSAYYISSQPACIWDIDCSDWIGVAASCDNRGYISGLLLKDLMKILPGCKSYRYRQILLKTSIKENTVEEKEGRDDKNTNLSKKCQKFLCNETDKINETKEQREPKVNKIFDVHEQLSNDSEMNSSHLKKEPRTAHVTDVSKSGNNKDYHTLVSESVLHFEEYHKAAKYCPQDKNSDRYNRPSIAAIKSLSFNPNHLQCCWLAYGGNSGLVRIINLQKVLAINTQAYMKTNLYI